MMGLSILDIPDFYRKNYENPRGMYDSYSKVEEVINKAIGALEAAEYEHYFDMADKLIKDGLGTAFHMENDKAEDIRKYKANIKILQERVKTIKDNKFHQFFTINYLHDSFTRDIRYAANHTIYLYPNIESFLEHQSVNFNISGNDIDSATKANIDKYPLLSNFLKFNMIEIPDDTCAVINCGMKFICVQAINGEYVVLKI